MTWIIVLLAVLITAAHVGYLWDVFSGRHGDRARGLK